MKISNVAAVLATSAVTSGLLVVGAPAATAETVTKTISFEHQCRVDGFTDWDFSFSDNLEVTAPEGVRPGQEFTVRLHPGIMRSSDATKTGRLKYDFAVPQGAELLEYALVDGTSSNLTGEVPVLLRVGADGNVDDAGEYLRITGSGNLTVNDGPAGNDNNPAEGLQVNRDTDFRLPAVELKLRAGEENTEVTTAVRAGAATPAIKIRDTSMSFGESRFTNAAGYCVAADPGRGALSTTGVFWVSQTETAVKMALEALTGDDVKIAAQVNPNPGEGTIEFYDGTNLIGTASVNAEGYAEMVWPFRDAGEHQITARFVGTAKFASSTSDDKTVTVTVPGVIVVEPTDPVNPDGPDTPGSLGSLSDLLPGLMTGSAG